MTQTFNFFYFALALIIFLPVQSHRKPVLGKTEGLNTQTPLKAGGGEIVEAVENVTAGKQTAETIS